MGKVPKGGTKLRPAVKKRNSRLNDIMGQIKGGRKKSPRGRKR